MSQNTIAPPKSISIELESHLESLIHDIEKSACYRAVMADDSDPKLVTSILKNIYLAISWYQPHVTEATFTAVGRMPKSSEQMIKSMILQQVEEVEHADMALRDFSRLGGDLSVAEKPASPACMAVAAMCRFLGEHCHPASYLGFMYIFEALTPVMASRVQAVMTRLNYDASAREFVDFHAEEDIRHTDMVVGMIEDINAIAPEAAGHVLHGFDSFAQVYPIPVWDEALLRAYAELKS